MKTPEGNEWLVVEEENITCTAPEYWIYRNGERVAVLDADFKTDTKTEKEPTKKLSMEEWAKKWSKTFEMMGDRP
jgi:hypothetical protein